jgi:hypothetical protein
MNDKKLVICMSEIGYGIHEIRRLRCEPPILLQVPLSIYEIKKTEEERDIK